MRKTLIIANMLFAAATVFGMKYDSDEIRIATENSLLTVQFDDDLRRALAESDREYRLQQANENKSKKKRQLQKAKKAKSKFDDDLRRALAESDREYQLQKAKEAIFQAELQKVIENFEIMSVGSQKDKEDFLMQGRTKEGKIKSEGLLDTFISEKQPYDRKLEELSNVSVFVNPGEYTQQTLHMLRNQDKYTFAQRDHGGTLNNLGNQCSILALCVDESVMNRIQRIKVIRNDEGVVLYVTEEDNMQGAITLGEYMKPIGGLPSDREIIWNKIAEILECRIDIFEFLNQGEDVNKHYHTGGQLYMISSYGTQFKKVKRLRLDSDPKGQGGHYVELRVFGKEK